MGVTCCENRPNSDFERSSKTRARPVGGLAHRVSTSCERRVSASCERRKMGDRAPAKPGQHKGPAETLLEVQPSILLGTALYTAGYSPLYCWVLMYLALCI